MTRHSSESQFRHKYNLHLRSRKFSKSICDSCCVQIFSPFHHQLLCFRVGCAWPRHSLFLNTLLPTPVIRSQLRTPSWRGDKDTPQLYPENCQTVLWSHKRHLWCFNSNNKKSHHWHVKWKIPRADVITWFRHLLQISSVRTTSWNKFHPKLNQFYVLMGSKSQGTLFILPSAPSFFWN